MIDGYPLSPQQKRLWTLRGEPVAPYTAGCAVTVRGGLDRERLRRALDALVARHEILRTRFRCLPGMTIPLQVVEPGGGHRFTEGDLGSDGQGAREARIAELLHASPEADDGGDAALDVTLVPLGPDEHLLIVRVPALCADSAAVRVLVAELARTYSGAPAGDGGEEAIQYADLAGWQNELLESEERASGREYWDRLRIDVPHAELPFGDRPADDDAPKAFRPERVAGPMPDGVTELARRTGASPETVLLACWQVLLWRLTGEPDVLVATAFDGRRYAELRDAVGLLVRFLPVRRRLDPSEPFTGLARRLSEQMLEHREWQEYFSWERAVRGNGGPPAPFALFAFAGHPAPESLSAGAVDFRPLAQYECIERFVLQAVSHGADRAGTGEGRLEVHFDGARIGREEAERVLGELTAVVTSAAEEPETAIGDLELIGPAEAAALRRALTGEATEPPAAPVHELFFERAARAPEETAVIAGGEPVSYGELARRAGAVAEALRASGVGPGHRVGLCDHPSVDLLAAVLGTLEAGAAYVPLDPSYPAERLAFLAADSRAQVVLVRESLIESLPERALEGDVQVLSLDRAAAGEPSPGPATAVFPESPAYVIYTSGSTGRPKGVVVSHRSLAHSTGARRRCYGEPGRQLLLASFSFDSSVAGIFWALAHGGTLMLPPAGAQREPRLLARWIAEHGIEVFVGLPSVFALLLQEAEEGQLASLRTAVVAGEVCPRETVARCRRDLPGLRLCNEYGPTEGTVWTTVFDTSGLRDDGRPVPIGRPIERVDVHLAHEGLRRVPTGVPGELLVGGAGLAIGYLDRPGVTAERFVPDPFVGAPGARLYRSGDVARLRADGELEFVGRTDEQVKIRGYRVEPGEIEALLESHPAVGRAAVVVREEEDGSRALSAFLVPDPSVAPVAARALRMEAEGRLDPARLTEMPDGLPVVEHRRQETEFLYREIFRDLAYLRGGVGLPDGACVFDVGANIGAFTLFVASRCEDPKVFAFEPIPPIRELLRANAELHGIDATVLDCGLAGQRGSVPFTYYPNLSLMSGRHVDPEADRELIRTFELGRDEGGETGAAVDAALLDEMLDARLATETVVCPVRTLSDVIAEHGVERIDLLKIDAEKSELEILDGVEEGDWPKIAQIVLETQEEDLDRVLALLDPRGYRVTVERDSAVAGGGLVNVFAVRPGVPTGTAAREESGEAPGGRAVRSAGPTPEALVAAVREHLAARVPEHMVPTAWRALDALPRTANGKVDRKALAALEPRRPESAEHVPPRGPVEEGIAAIWSEVLRVERVGASDNFFELGGHSLVATQVMSRVRTTFGADLPVRTLFRAPTVEALAAAVAEARRVAPEAAASEVPPIEPALRNEPLPLSYSQQRLWFVHRMEPDSPAYNVVTALRLTGRLDRDALGRSMDEVVRRHEVLRTVFPLVGETPVQKVLPPEPGEYELTDLSDRPEGEREEALARIVHAESRRPFDLAEGPLLRARVVRLDDREHAVVTTLHHIVSDAWSTGVLVSELAACYEAFVSGAEPDLPELPVQYGDFAVWQRSWLRDEVLEAQLGYWRERLAGLPTLDLPSDRPRPAQRSDRGGKIPVELPEELTAGVRELARAEGATTFMVALAAFQVVLRAHTGQDDLVVGTNVANRNRLETERLIGFFVNQLVLRTALSDDLTFRQLVARVGEEALAAYAHQDVPFEKLVEALDPERDPSRPLLYQVKLDVQNAPMSALELPGLRVTPLELDRQVVRYDLHLSLSESERGLRGSVLYSAELFERETAERYLEGFLRVLGRAVAEPDARVGALQEELLAAEREARERRREDRKRRNLTNLHRTRRRDVAAPEEAGE